MRFGLDQPAFYALMDGQPHRSPPPAARDARARLVELLEGAAAQGIIDVPAETAADIVLAANVGVTLTLIGTPADDPDLGVSDHLRDAVIDSLTRPR